MDMTLAEAVGGANGRIIHFSSYPSPASKSLEIHASECEFCCLLFKTFHADLCVLYWYKRISSPPLNRYNLKIYRLRPCFYPRRLNFAIILTFYEVIVVCHTVLTQLSLFPPNIHFVAHTPSTGLSCICLFEAWPRHCVIVPIHGNRPTLLLVDIKWNTNKLQHPMSREPNEL